MNDRRKKLRLLLGYAAVYVTNSGDFLIERGKTLGSCRMKNASLSTLTWFAYVAQGDTHRLVVHWGFHTFFGCSVGV